MHRRVAAIANPCAGGGRVGRLWPQLAQRLRARFGDLSLRLTESPRHATRITRELIENGFDLIIAVGGDGTISDVVNGFLYDDTPLCADVELGIVPVGTGGDFRRTLGIPADPGQAVEILSGGKALAIDVGKISLVADDGSAVRRYFVNLVSFGMGGEVAANVRNLLTMFGGRTAFLWATLKSLVTYHGRRIELELDRNGQLLPFFISNVALGNGRYHGGGMQPCPEAILDDGLLDVTVIDYMNPLEVLRDIRALYSGDVYRLAKVHRLQACRLAGRAEQPTAVEVDGEVLGRLPLEVEVLPRRLNVLLSPSSPHFASSRARLADRQRAIWPR
jgi:diacylglycerol kinase (ATP)